MGEIKIRNLENLIQQHLGSHKKLVDSQVTKLTAPGENYLGIVLKVVATLKDENGKEEKFNAVAKCLNFNLPDFMKKMVRPQYIKERAFYVDIVPALQEFQEEQGLETPSVKDIFATLYSCRSSLDESSTEPDENAVLLLENLHETGFSNADRTVGFDLNGAELILKDLAIFHAVPIAFKIKKPEEFEDKIKKHLKHIINFDDNGPPPDFLKENIWLKVLEEYDEVKPYFTTLQELLNMDPKTFKERMHRIPTEPFASISHGDLWTNNTMQVFIDGKAIKNKLVDFQGYNYESITHDLLFFICTSIQTAVLKEHFDSLIKFYHKHFVDILNKLGCDTSLFSYENLLEEMNGKARREIGRIIFMLMPIFGKKGEAAVDFTSGGPLKLKKENISEAAKQRAIQIILLFGEKGWI